MQGRIVRTWESEYTPGQEAYLLENGHLLRPAKLSGNEARFAGAGSGGRVQEFTWEGDLVWDFKFHNDKQIQHHAITRMPNGNVLLIVWERKTAKEAIAAGVKPATAGRSDMLVDSLVEIKPMGMTGGQVVWEWHLWDHLIQDQDKTKANYGDVALHPELVDVNHAWNSGFAAIAQILAPFTRKGETKKGPDSDKALDKLKSIGYVGAGGGNQFMGFMPDWTHVNSVAYNAKLDQIVLSVRSFNEIWIIDHSTTTAEAAGHTGGRSGKGGDLLYRWGNPRAYRAGSVGDQRLFGQHDAHWIPEGVPGAGHILVFNNGGGQPRGNHSSVDEIVLPVDAKGRYAYKPGTAYGPDKAVWSYTAPKKSHFFAPLMSGAQRLPNGNTLICTGFSGTLFEVTPKGETVWRYIVPNDTRSSPGGFGPPPKGFQLVPPFVRGALALTDEQNKQLAEVQRSVEGKLDRILEDDQKTQFKEMQGGKGGFGAPPQPGQILTPFQQARLKLTADQKQAVAALQQETDAKLDKTLTADQKKQLKTLSATVGRGGPNPPGPPGKGGFGGFPGFGPGGGSAIFRGYRYAPNYPGLVGRDLAPGRTIEAMERKEPKEKKSP
jgi:hypothetical protein